MTDSRNKGGRRIVLASGSPRRRELLAAMGYEFTLCTPDVDEHIAGTPEDLAKQDTFTAHYL